ncbi:MAG: hypothetical protein HYX75_17345 [Acidobacteria bacterium]|nr:hypothetical protein [Acidobacteriota bacterium]
MYCQRCGKTLPEGVSICPHCARSSLPPPIPTNTLERPTIVTVLAVLQFIGGGVFGLGALALLAAAASREAGAGSFIFLFALLAAAALQILCGHGLWQLKSHGRSIQIVLACIGLLAIPLGTVISVLILIYLFRPGAKILFSGKTWAELTPAERGAVAQLPSGGGAVIAVAVVAVASVFFIGIIAAIAIPNLITAIQRGKQKRTVMEMRTLAIALEKYGADHLSYPAASSIQELGTLLSPKYVPRVSLQDGWRHDFKYEAWSEDDLAPGPTTYVLASAGRDHDWEFSSLQGYTENETVPREFDRDIVVQSGEFIQYPGGLITK